LCGLVKRECSTRIGKKRTHELGWRFPVRLNVRSSRYILVPKLRMLSYETTHQLDTGGVIDQEHVNAVGKQEFDIARKVLVLSDDYSPDTELKDGSRAHHARAERRVESDAVISCPPAGSAEAIHFAVSDRIAVLHPPIVAARDHSAVLGHCRADGQSSFVVRGFGLIICFPQKLLIELELIAHC